MLGWLYDWPADRGNRGDRAVSANRTRMPTITLLYERVVCRIFKHDFVPLDPDWVICRRCRRMQLGRSIGPRHS